MYKINTKLCNLYIKIKIKLNDIHYHIMKSVIHIFLRTLCGHNSLIRITPFYEFWFKKFQDEWGHGDDSLFVR